MAHKSIFCLKMGGSSDMGFDEGSFNRELNDTEIIMEGFVEECYWNVNLSISESLLVSIFRHT